MAAAVEQGAAQPKYKAIVVSDLNGVRTIRFNNPKKLNGWSPLIMAEMAEALKEAAADEAVSAAILTGTGKYYCAGVDFAGSLKPMHPREFKARLTEQNQALFDQFLDFPKPLFAALNGPAIGAAVTSAGLCDQIIASDTATLHTPFKSLGLVPEGCSSFTFPLVFGDTVAKEVLEGRKLSAQEAVEFGYAAEVVPEDQVQQRAQQVAEEWVASGRPRRVQSEGNLEQLKAVNAKESVALANAMLDYPFLNHMIQFAKAKKKYTPYLVFLLAKTTRPLWSRL
mmetsp:Transcript_21928/g.62355  ORF Transcript_21928/g.62355 Transcript_21928/m.62355 type:complete len:282 (+) Transcript_21928:86-931(+)|eukprot:CAMPEP_0202072898 /NCGR_PEP_ID=MMETSP0964-20121228/2718_1 /ASSEMBLY_ACC=CAM_ASM_000500 /TAXON_ID=4773 /ORGANISM="Schizochytrium aggregatum, Strain ATCC28209" /LENGTH=281 /DNA_ID=CAMNT_0048639965 /DNA_START=34 /DNA_END=879 /DNA_ORIENTATION=+